MKEMQQMSEAPLEGIKIQINDADVTDIQALIEGPGKYMYNVFRTIQTNTCFVGPLPVRKYMLL